MRLRARCPAKINLALRVLGKRPDGYHELDTVFQTVDLCDELVLEPADGLELVCEAPGVPADGSNLVVRAARALAAAAGVPARGRLTLHKSIPVQGGMGGGSSDAAAALLLCARAWGLALPEAELQRLAASLGADVPFFLVGGTARGRGRGDRITPLPPVPPTPLLLGFPPFGVPSGEVFARLSEQLTPPENGVSVPVPFAVKWQEGNDFSLGTNDLEPVVFRGWPELRRFRDGLRAAGSSMALLSGSGSTVFGMFEETSRLDRALAELRADFAGWTLAATRTAAEGVRVEGGP